LRLPYPIPAVKRASFFALWEEEDDEDDDAPSWLAMVQFFLLLLPTHSNLIRMVLLFGQEANACCVA
jgi:hypothetical protein